MQGSFWWMSQESWYQGQRFKLDSLRGLFLGNQRAFEYRTTNKKCTELVLFEIPVNQLMNAYGIPIKCFIFCSDNQDSQGTGSLEWIYTIKGDAVHWLTDVNWVSQQWPSAHWRGWETECLSGHEIEYFSCLNLALKAWRFSGEFLTFSPCWKPQKL